MKSSARAGFFATRAFREETKVEGVHPDHERLVSYLTIFDTVQRAFF